MSVFVASGLISNLLILTTTNVSNGATIYSNTLHKHLHNWTGDTSILVTLTHGSDNVTIQQQCSVDGTTFYTPVDSSGTTQGTVYTNLTASTFITFTPVVSTYVRFSIVASADSTVKLNLITRE